MGFAPPLSAMGRPQRGYELANEFVGIRFARAPDETVVPFPKSSVNLRFVSPAFKSGRNGIAVISQMIGRRLNSACKRVASTFGA